MKHLYKLSLTIISIVVFLSLCYSQQKLSDFYLPFSEDWHFENFEINRWTIGSDNWVIDTQNGNEEPSAKFHSTPLLSDYSSSLLSNPIDAQNIKVGHVYLKFDLKLNDNNDNGTEFFKIKVSDSTGWHSIDSISNNGSFDWTTYTYDIKNYTRGQIFQFKFEAAGSNSMNINDWYIDNIEVYRECDAPEDLWGEIVWLYDENIIGSNIIWNAPSSIFQENIWKNWDDGENKYGISPICEDCWVEAAVSWPSSMLEDNVYDTIDAIRFFSNGYITEGTIIKVRTGDNGENIIYSDTLTTLVNDDWTLFELNDYILIQPDTKYWISYEVQPTDLNNFSFGTDNGPVASDYSNLIKFSQNGDWVHLNGLGFNYNWNLQMLIRKEAEMTPENLKGFQLYVMEDPWQEFEFLSYVEFNENDQNYSFFDTCYYGICDAFYKVNALWANESDTCISDYAPALINPSDDFIYIVYEGLEEKNDHLVELYPNPSKSHITINSKSLIKKISIYNSVGLEVMYFDNIKETQKTISISNFEPGIYFIKIQTDINTLTKKFIKQ